MSNLSQAHPLYTRSGCWITRGLGLMVNAFFLLILFLTLTNEDSVTPQGWPVVVSLLVAVLGVFIALRWERLGGRLALIGAVALIPAVLYSAYLTGFQLESLLIGLVVYPIPFFIVASLFLADAQAG